MVVAVARRIRCKFRGSGGRTFCGAPTPRRFPTGCCRSRAASPPVYSPFPPLVGWRSASNQCGWSDRARNTTTPPSTNGYREFPTFVCDVPLPPPATSCPAHCVDEVSAGLDLRDSGRTWAELAWNRAVTDKQRHNQVRPLLHCYQHFIVCSRAKCIGGAVTIASALLLPRSGVTQATEGRCNAVLVFGGRVCA
jgi:hypothetical protein